ncbi:hypothetical protein B4129_3748 [Bacillus safensis]|nr:hypothetical protein B4129_3748 [Bacillus safensis]
MACHVGPFFFFAQPHIKKASAAPGAFLYAINDSKCAS